MKILALEKDRPGISSSDFDPHLQAEARAVWDLQQSGFVREIYFREGPSQAVLILEAGSTDQAQLMLAQLPLVQAGLTEFEVIGLRPYPGFERLFAD
jgi:hypothetical protein